MSPSQGPGALAAWIAAYVASLFFAASAGYQKRVKEEQRERTKCVGFNKAIRICKAFGGCEELEEKNCGEEELDENELTAENYPGIQALLDNGQINEQTARDIVIEIVADDPDYWLGDPEPIEEGGDPPLELPT